MRTFPRELAAFREMVNARGSELRQLNYSALQERAKAPLEHGTVQGRRAKIGIIELPAPDGSIRVVVQGFMKGRWFFSGCSVALDGFYTFPDGRVAVMPDSEFNEFDQANVRSGHCQQLAT